MPVDLEYAARRAAALALFAITPSAAWAHTGEERITGNIWTAWQFTPDIVAGVLLAAALYGAGLWRARQSERVRAGRAVLFYAGLATTFVALQSFIDVFAERVFALHQVQHLLLHALAPMLLMLAVPQALLIGGMPNALRRIVLAPVMTDRAVRAVFGFLAQPAVATFLFVGTLYFWQIPSYHDLAVLNDGVHYAMHVTMLFAGLVFFWRIFDPRPAPQGSRYLVRAAMLWVAICTNIVLGAYLTFKSTVLYTSYDVPGRLWVHDALQDEVLGGLILWIPGTMMCVIALLIVIRLWSRNEARREDWRQRGLARTDLLEPMPGTTVALARSKNRALASRLAVISLIVFAAAIGVAVLDMFL